jgi:NADPH:quinone reductase-like Zn-dependent oxidoreductase
METMKAVRIHSYGGPEVLVYEEAPRPTPDSGELLAQVHAAGVNPIDWKVREGYLKDILHHSLPLILGWDFAGVVETIGPGVMNFKNGDAIYGHRSIARNGAYAQYIAVKESEVALKPKSIDHIHAAAVPVAALIAWQALFVAAQLKSGQSVLIHGAAGGVGSLAVQFAKWRSAHVIGTASGRNQEFIRGLGVDGAINYEKTHFEDLVRNVDVVFDTIGGETQKRSWKVLRKGGVLVSIVEEPSAEEAASHGVRPAYVVVQPNARQLADIAELVDAGKLRAVVETVLPLSDARRAHRLIQTGHTRGRIVLKVR